MAYPSFEQDPNYVEMPMPLGMAGVAQGLSGGGSPSMSQALNYGGNAPMVNGTGYNATGSVAGAAGAGQAGNGLNANGVPMLNGWQKFSNLMSGLGSLSNIYMGYKSYKLAKDQLNFQKQSYATDLRNRVTDYNGQMTDMHTARGVMQGDGAGTVQDRIERDRMTTSA